MIGNARVFLFEGGSDVSFEGGRVVLFVGGRAVLFEDERIVSFKGGTVVLFEGEWVILFEIEKVVLCMEIITLTGNQTKLSHLNTSSDSSNVYTGAIYDRCNGCNIYSKCNKCNRNTVYAKRAKRPPQEIRRLER